MKKFFSFIITFSLAIMAQAQDTLYLQQKTGGLLKFPISNIDSMFFLKPTLVPTGSPTIDGYTYPTVTIGTQVWMAENLRTTTYSDGTTIPLVTDSTAWSNIYNNQTKQPAMCWYNNDQATYTANKYGALYNWYAVNTGKLCPSGWHVPTYAEWTTLIDYLGDAVVAGGKMKTTGTTHWLSPNTGATNSSGFSGLPGGVRGSNGTFYFIGLNGHWWISYKIYSNDTMYLYLKCDSGYVGNYLNSKADGLSVRCVRD